MSAVERVEYMDSQKSAMMDESIRREQRVQREFFRQQEAAGRLKPVSQDSEKTRTSSRKTDVKPPAFTQTIKNDPELSIGMQLSRSMWVSNPGYVLRDGQKTVSSFKEDYVWDEEELKLMKEFGMFSKTHNRRRDDFTHYVESSAKYSLLTKKPQA